MGSLTLFWGDRQNGVFGVSLTRLNVVPRSFLKTFVFALPLLVVSFSVVMGGYALAHATNDNAGAAVLWWVAMGCLMLICVDLVLLVGALGANALAPPERRQDDPDP
jgi:hypothetical protein